MTVERPNWEVLYESEDAGGDDFTVYCGQHQDQPVLAIGCYPTAAWLTRQMVRAILPVLQQFAEEE
jgi:hypothetical protein